MGVLNHWVHGLILRVFEYVGHFSWVKMRYYLFCEVIGMVLRHFGVGYCNIAQANQSNQVKKWIMTNQCNVIF